MNSTRIHHIATRLSHSVFLFLSFAILSAGILHAQSYTVVDLGTLGGHASGGDGINNDGEVVGWSIDDPYGYYAYKSTPAGPPLTNLGSPPNGSYSYAQSINDYDQVVGYADVTVGFGVYDRAFLWENGTMIDLGTLGGNGSQAWSVNNAGQVVGWAADEGPGYHAFIWEDGVMTELPGFPIGYPDSEARGINEAGIAVGYSWDNNSVRQAVVWENGAMSMILDLIPEATGAKAYAINNHNQIVGNVWTPGNRTRAILWDEYGNATELPNTASHYYNRAYDINDQNQIVGESYSGGHLTGSSGGPVIWENGIAFELDDIVESTPGISLHAVYGINEAGQIAATGNASGNYRAIRLDPIPDGLGLSGPDPGYTGTENELAVRGATPGERVYFVYGLVEGLTAVPGCTGEFVNIQNAAILGFAIADEYGHAIFSEDTPNSASGRTIWFQAVEPTSCRVSNPTSHYFF